MASGMGTDEPPPIPPPDYTKESTSDFAKRSMPPLRGLMVDPKYPPTYQDAQHLLSKGQTRQPPQTPSSHITGSQVPPTQTPRIPYDHDEPPPQSQSPQAAPSQAPTTDIHRSSGASQIFSAAPTTDEVINTIPLGTRHTAGGEKPNQLDTSIPSILSTIKPSSYKTFHQQPCVRESLLQGIIAGFLTGGILFVLGKPIGKAANWSVGVFVPTMIAGHEYCQRTRRREKAGMKVAVEIIEGKKEEKRKRMEEKRERFRVAREEKMVKEMEVKREEEGKRRWWDIWHGRGREG